MFLLIDVQTANIVGVYPTREEAQAEIDAEREAGGDADVLAVIERVTSDPAVET